MKRFFSSRLAAVASLLFVACGGGHETTPTGLVQTTTTTGTTGPWRGSSTRLDIACGGFFDGSMRFVADRAAMSDAQLTILAGLRVAPSDGMCGEDGDGCSLAITDMDGSVTTYLASSNGTGCAASEHLDAIAFDQVAPLQKTLTCRYSKADLGEAKSSPVVPDARCYDGMFTGGPGTFDVSLDVAVAGTRHVELAGCSGENQVGKIAATILAPSSLLVASLAPVAAADAGPDGTCARVEASFLETGTYTLRVTIDDGFLPVGDFWLRYY